MSEVVDGMWFVFVPPFAYKGKFFETVFLTGESLQAASIIDITVKGDRPGDDSCVSWSKVDGGYKQCKLHRLLAFSLLYNGVYPPGGAYHERSVVDHKDKHHDNNLLNNLRLMPKRPHDALPRRR